MKDLEDMCMHYYISREQRKTELYNGSGLKGTQGYEIKGCYECNGFKYLCDTYVSKNNLMGLKNEQNIREISNGRVFELVREKT